MYHSYLIASPSGNILVSIDVEDTLDAGCREETLITYRNREVYIDGKRVGRQEVLQISRENILLFHCTEGIN